MGRLTTEALAGFREGLRYRKIDRPLSEEVVRFTQTGTEPSRDELVTRYGYERGKRLHERIVALLGEIAQIELPATRREAVRALRRAHRELNEEALTTLADRLAAP